MPTKDDPVVTVRFPEELHRRLRAEALVRYGDDRGGKSRLVREAVEQALGGFPEGTRSGTQCVAAEGIKEAPVTEHPAPAESPSWLENEKKCPVGCPPSRPDRKLCEYCQRLLEG
jgi:1-acyl-sn-glycerol-3-phosphate acyltransferase